MNYVSIFVATVLEVPFFCSKEGDVPIILSILCITICTNHWCLVMSFCQVRVMDEGEDSNAGGKQRFINNNINKNYPVGGKTDWQGRTRLDIKHTDSDSAARLVFNEPKRAHVTPLFVSLHWLPVAARIQFKTLMLAYRTTTGSAPTYFHSLLRIYIPSRSLRSASERRLVVPSQRNSKSLSRTFSFTVPGRWNDLPTPIRNAGSLSIFKQQLKNLFQLYLTT